jgi:hydrogenase maturation protein HypF
VSSTRRIIRVRGVVQGVGFRPFVHTLASSLGLAGTVHNDTAGVVIAVEGDARVVDEFERRLSVEAPPLASITSVSRSTEAPTGDAGFHVIASERSGSSVSSLPPDVAVCDDCIRELFDPDDRRHRHPFITCTNCGPRFTITTALPYDRPNTTMAGFPLCEACQAEYDDPTDRRFHAQPLACADCGPQLELVEATTPETVRGDEALRGTSRLLDDGAIVAVKGVGGYHLMCDATNAEAVATLRARKGRGAKPLAVMVADEETALRAADLDDVERRALTSPQRPIVLARRRPDAPPWASLVAPSTCDVGLMLPYAPVHHLLFDGATTRVLVCTSGNLSDEPIVTDPHDAHERLGRIADAWLHHDRPIHTACDDSITRVVRGRAVPLRRARGFVPLPIELAPPLLPRRPVLALGGDLKGAVCVADGERAWLSQHLGDLASLETYRAARRAIDQLLDITRVRPQVVAVDAHPGYLSARLGREVAAELGLPVVPVFHHHAHVASALAESGREAAVIGFAFDGTGYGPDGAIWGGEVLVADARRSERVAHLGEVPLPGGDAAIEHPARTALAHLWAAGCPWDERIPAVAAIAPLDRSVVQRQLERHVATVPTSSMGRLFDAVASIAGVRHQVSYEAQAAIELEAVAQRSCRGAYEFPLPDATGAIEAAPVIRAVVDDVRCGQDTGVISMRFHRAVVNMVARSACDLREWRGLHTVALTGGVFQNALLAELCAESLTAEGFEVLQHLQVPPNDGGLALGQALVAGVCSDAAG